MKPLADKAFRNGVNANILHLVVSQPGDDSAPPVRLWFGTFFDRRSDATSASLPRLARYLKRCNFLLQQGDPIGPHTRAPLRGWLRQHIRVHFLPDGTTIDFTESATFRITRSDTAEIWNADE